MEMDADWLVGWLIDWYIIDREIETGKDVEAEPPGSSRLCARERLSGRARARAWVPFRVCVCGDSTKNRRSPENIILIIILLLLLLLIIINNIVSHRGEAHEGGGGDGDDGGERARHVQAAAVELARAARQRRVGRVLRARVCVCVCVFVCVCVCVCVCLSEICRQ